MNTRSNPSVFDAYHTAEPDEPVFTIKASDEQSDELVTKWAQDRLRRTQLGLEPASDLDKVIEALGIAQSMRDWRKQTASRPQSQKEEGNENEFKDPPGVTPDVDGYYINGVWHYRQSIKPDDA